jgi:glycosyltransferase involved in cell wall biosynthesis
MEHGFRVSAAQESELFDNNADVGLNPKIERYFISTGNTPPLMIQRMLRVMQFRRGVRQLVRKLRPDIILAYDAESAHAVGDSAVQCGARLVWHFHEVPEDPMTGWTIKLANRYVWQNARKPDLIVFPDPGRADVFAGDAGIERSTFSIVANCPRSVRRLPQPTLRDILADRLTPHAGVVLYHGAIGQDHALEIAIRSMPKWPMDTFFVAKGRVERDYATHLNALAESVGMAHRLILFDPGFQSTEDHYAFIVGADVGWTVLEPVSNAWKHSVLASNKRFECMALGVPQIADNSTGLPELIERNHCGVCIPHDSIDAAAAAVNRLLVDEKLRKQMSARARGLHLQEYNYDEQFKPVLNSLKLMF